jgi:hypothetical protein
LGDPLFTVVEAPNKPTAGERKDIVPGTFPSTLFTMHWLQTLDTNLFLFFNRLLVNPFLDWLMPVLNGDHGVHYPSDVTAGALIGAGYAAAACVAIETAWRHFGRKWCPRWFAQMLSLVPDLNLR